MNLPFNPESLPELIEGGYIISQSHPTLPLKIYNYTAKTQYEGYWIPATICCRGLILTDNNELVGRPLPKFFNVGQHQGQLPPGIPQIYEKLDGSLIILGQYLGEWIVASRGSFISEQCEFARKLTKQRQSDLDKLNPHYTYLFEAIYPRNRIVVNYGEAERLVFLAAIETATGIELDFDRISWSDKARVYPATTLPEFVRDMESKSSDLSNEEGFVLRWDNGFRLKYKVAEYVRLHRIMSKVQAKDIWECLSQGRDLDEFLDSVPDEFYAWVRKIELELKGKFASIEAECQQAFKSFPSRRETASYFQTQKYPGVLFLMLDNRNYGEAIWKTIKPAYQRPFLIDRDG